MVARIILYDGSGEPDDYPNTHDISISPSGVLTFYWETLSKPPKAFKVQTTVPYVVSEEIPVSS